MKQRWLLVLLVIAALLSLAIFVWHRRAYLIKLPPAEDVSGITLNIRGWNDIHTQIHCEPTSFHVVEHFSQSLRPDREGKWTVVGSLIIATKGNNNAVVLLGTRGRCRIEEKYFVGPEGSVADLIRNLAGTALETTDPNMIEKQEKR